MIIKVTPALCGYCNNPGTKSDPLIDPRPRVFKDMHVRCVEEYLVGSAWRRQPAPEDRP